MKQIKNEQFNYVHNQQSTWCVQDQPSTKLYEKGVTSLTDTDLIAVLLGGVPNAAILARTLYAEAGNNLFTLATFSLSNLTNFKGLTERKASALVAAFELGRRTQNESNDKLPIKNSETVYNLLKPTIADLQHEEFWLITLNRAHRVIGRYKISQGGLSGTVIDTRIILKKSLDDLACSIIVSHNHPSGNTQPSEADIKITKKLKDAAEILEIKLLDHVIVTKDSYFSLADEGLI